MWVSQSLWSVVNAYQWHALLCRYVPSCMRIITLVFRPTLTIYMNLDSCILSNVHVRDVFQLWTVALCMTQPMAELVTILRCMTKYDFTYCRKDYRSVIIKKVNEYMWVACMHVSTIMQWCLSWKWWWSSSMPKDPHCLMVLSTVAILYNAPEYQDEFGQTTTYSFNPGYNLVGDGTRICQATGL